MELLKCARCERRFEVVPGALDDTPEEAPEPQPDPLIRCPYCGAVAEKRHTLGHWVTIKAGALDRDRDN